MERLQSFRWTGTLNITPPGIEAPITVVVARPNRARLEYEIMGNVGIQAIDGDAAWWHAPMSGAPTPTEAPEPIERSLRSMADVDGLLVGWQGSGHAVRLVGRTEVDGRQAIELEVRPAFGGGTRYFLDAASYLLIQTVDLDDSTAITRFSDHRDVSGLKLPFVFEKASQSGTQKTTIAEWKLNVEPAASLFAVPEGAARKVGREAAPRETRAVVTTVAEIDAGTGGIELDATGNIYSADFGRALGDPAGVGRRVWRIDRGGRASIVAEGFAGASGNAFDASGNLFQSNIAGNRIDRISPAGEVSLFARQGLDRPVGLVIDGEGTLFVANCGDGSIQRLTRDGESSRVVESPLLACPNGITIDAAKHLYVSNFYNGDVVKMTPGGEVRRLATLPGGNNGHLTYANERLYVVARGAHRIYEVSTDGEYRVLAGTGTRGNADGPALEASFCFPNDIAASADGRTLVVNEVAGCSADGRQLAPTKIRRITLE